MDTTTEAASYSMIYRGQFTTTAQFGQQQAFSATIGTSFMVIFEQYIPAIFWMLVTNHPLIWMMRSARLLIITPHIRPTSGALADE